MLTLSKFQKNPPKTETWTSICVHTTVTSGELQSCLKTQVAKPYFYISALLYMYNSAI